MMGKKRHLWAIGPAVLLAVGCSGLNRGLWSKAPKDMAGTPLIDRTVLFGNPDRASPRISHDGTKLAYLAAVEGVLNVWVGPIDDPEAARPVTKDMKRGIRFFTWSYDKDFILYIQDKGGDENWHVYATNLATNETRDLTPFDGVQARIQATSEKQPGEVLLAVNDRNKRFHDVFRVDIRTGERTLVQQNDEYVGFVNDDDFTIRLAQKFTGVGAVELHRKTAAGDWSLYRQISGEDVLTTAPIGFDKSGRKLYMIDSVGRNTAALVEVDFATGQSRHLASNPRADVSGTLTHPTEKHIQAATFTYQRKEWQVLDQSIQRDLDYLATVADGDLSIGSRTLDDRHWIATYVVDNGPVRYYHYDRDVGKARFLFTNRKELENLPLSKTQPVVIRSRDGLDLVSYCTLPAWSDRDANGRPSKPLPMVLYVHGGPWARDNWGYNPTHQWLANRGHAALSVNYRGSTGLGKNFANAANRQWAAKMHDDLIDAVDWAIREKIADPDRVAIMGGSYGGYATLVGVTFTPEKFACGVDIVGPSSLITLLENVPPYWVPILPLMKDRVGDFTTPEGREFLKQRSPLTFVHRIERPLLIGQGANDPRVNQVESDQIVEAMNRKNIPVTYVLYPDEGHGFARPENRLSFYAVAEAFLAKHIGGRYQQIGEDFEGSSITVPEGADQIPGVQTSLAR